MIFVFIGFIVFGILLGITVVYLLARLDEDSPGLIEQIRKDLKNRSPNFEAMLTLGTALVLAYFVYYDIGIVNQPLLIAYALLLGLITVPTLMHSFGWYVLGFKNNLKGLETAAVLFGIGVLVWGYVTLGYANVLLDFGPVHPYKTTAKDSYTVVKSTRTGSLTSSFVTVEIRNESGELVEYDLPVYPTEIDGLNPRRTPVRFTLHDGLLGLRWVDVVMVGPMEDYASGYADQYRSAL